jgi:hypothetical protein
MAGDTLVRISDLVKNLDYASYPKAPARNAIIGMPPKP